MIDQQKISAMREGGRKLGQVRDALVAFTKVGMTFAEIEAEAQRLIKAAGGKPNFAMVPKYHWATCIMKTNEVCHGIPTKDKVVADGELIKIDVGMLYNGYHVDTSTSAIIGKKDPRLVEFLEIGRRSLDKAIAEAQVGNSVFDISFAMQKTAERKGYGMVYQLTGHGIGKTLHEDPMIPCVAQRRDKREILEEGQTIAIEIMYTTGSPALKLDADGWTFRTSDGSVGGMIEETVLVTKDGPEVLTRG